MFRQFLGFAQGEIGRCARLTSPFGEFGHSRRQIHRMATLRRNTYGVGMAKNLVVIGAGPGSEPLSPTASPTQDFPLG